MWVWSIIHFAKLSSQHWCTLPAEFDYRMYRKGLSASHCWIKLCCSNSKPSFYYYSCLIPHHQIRIWQLIMDFMLSVKLFKSVVWLNSTEHCITFKEIWDIHDHLRSQSDFFKCLEILVSQESWYIFHNPCQILHWKVFHLEDINENVPGYGNHN